MEAEAHNVEQVIGLEERAYQNIEKAVERDLIEYIDEIKENPKLLLSEEPVVPPPDITIIQETYTLLSTAWMMGMLHAAPQSADFADVDIIGDILASLDNIIVFEEALQRASGRVSLTPDQFKNLSNHLKNQAYTIGRLAQLDMIEKAKNHYLKQFTESGSSLNKFVTSIDYDNVTGTVGLPGYYETVYRTNIQNDYNAARAMQFQNNPPLFLEFIGISDSRQSDICSERTGIILPYSDPWWQENWPPLHYNCRSTVRGIYSEEAREMGLNAKGAKEWSKPYMAKSESAQSGFGANPVYNNQLWKGTAAEQSKIIRSLIQDEINQVAGQTVAEDFSREKVGYVSNNPENGRGGVRYPANLLERESDQGAKVNVEIAKKLASDKGYFIELRENELLEHNRVFDAWVNGIEGWELKDFPKASAGTMSNVIRKASEQAANVALQLHHTSQIDSLIRAIGRRIPEMKNAGRKINVMAVLFHDQVAYLSWETLQDLSRVKQILTALL